ncbi:MAG TPA: SCO family protein [Thermoanaerobaculia bacterium]|nr:SCO family protein [Thermoanaerobaculia bacterium]
MRSVLALGTFLLLLLTVAAAARPAPGTIPAPNLPDITVQTQDGTTVPFADLIRDRTVAINFVFTSCTTICPLMGTSFGRVQDLLGDQAKDVALISVSIDPEHDTPAKLTAWSKRFGVRPGWTLVTGRKPDIERLLRSLGVFTPNFLQHAPVAIIGRESRGVWRRLDGLAPPSKFVSVIRDVASTENASR